ncbi:unnamed protein product [Moneuplotes crassus]|uniref:Cytosol aminopeptidase domain-containing protein n=2 Tax=Euplotes crassus TaxID=5936 RepID=A0AAD1X7Z9_EUPCR|nr:unnamed protein product [Moneuplotes crassus]
MESKAEENTQFVKSKDFLVKTNGGKTLSDVLAAEKTVVMLINKDSLHLAESFDHHEMIKEDLKNGGFAWTYCDKTRVLLVHYKKETVLEVRALGVQAIETLRERKISEVTIYIPQKSDFKLSHTFIQSFMMWNYRFELKTIGGISLLTEINLAFEEELTENLKREVECLIVMVKSCLFARDVQNTRANIATCQYMEDLIKATIEGCDKVTECTVIKDKELLEQNFNLLYNVGKGSTIPPRCITCLYKGNPDEDEVHIAIVGKGVVFDTGGLNIKATGVMEDNFSDKGGACVTLAALKGIIELDLKINVVFAFGITENSVDAESYRPSDIITSKKGLTVEIMNTDAEGRLVLADVLWHVYETYKPTYCVDLATLTGTIITALGSNACGVFTNDDEFVEEFIQAGKEVNEQAWHMPIFDDHKEDILNDVSDLRNMGDDRKGHSSRAAAFMEHFVGEGTKWIHADIAGPTYLDSAIPPMPKYCTGFATQTVLSLLRKKSKS